MVLSSGKDGRALRRRNRDGFIGAFVAAYSRSGVQDARGHRTSGNECFFDHSHRHLFDACQWSPLVELESWANVSDFSGYNAFVSVFDPDP